MTYRCASAIFKAKNHGILGTRTQGSTARPFPCFLCIWSKASDKYTLNPAHVRMMPIEDARRKPFYIQEDCTKH